MQDAPPQDDPKIGTVLNGTYRLEAVLGVGGMGTVYRARHVHLGTEHAIKSLVPQFTANPEALKRFQREAQISSQLGHPNIVKVSDFNYDADGTPFMVMELLLGETLRARIARLGKLTLAQLQPIVNQLCAGLDAAHTHGVVHRDLKPENLFLCERTDLLKILDFGVSKIQKRNTQLTRPMAMLGTPYYMSPEQAMGNTADVDALSDVWAVGAIVFEALTGHAAFAANNPVAVFHKITNERMPAVTENGADVPQAVDGVLARACARVSSERYQSTGELARALEAAAQVGDQTQPTVFRDAGPTGSLPSRSKPRRPSPADDTPPPLPERPTELVAAGAPLRAAPTQILSPPRAESEPVPPGERRSKATPSSTADTALTALPRDQTTAPVAMPPERSGVAPNRAKEAQQPAPRSRRTPTAAGEARATTPSLPALPAVSRFARWPVIAIGLGGALAASAVIATVLMNRRHAEQSAGQRAIDEALAKRRWDDAERELRTQRAQFGESPELSSEQARVVAERRASAQLKLARELREHGDGAGAITELGAIGSNSAYASDAASERAAVLGGWEADLARALRERRCSDAQLLAKRLVSVDRRALSPEVAACEEDPRGAFQAPSAAEAQRAYKRRDWERALEIAQAVVKADPSVEAAWRTVGLSACALGNGEEARRARPHLGRDDQRLLDKLCRSRRTSSEEDPRHELLLPPGEANPTDAGGMQARDQMVKMLANAEPSARRCFIREPKYGGTMRLRVTAFPGSDRFVSTAISTGPIEIRICLEQLFKLVRPPQVTAAISAERIYGPGTN